jgi:hypothetical protein
MFFRKRAFFLKKVFTNDFSCDIVKKIFEREMNKMLNMFVSVILISVIINIIVLVVNNNVAFGYAANRLKI